MAFSKTFQRRVGPGSTPPLLGSDGVPSGASSVGASNAFSTVARSNGIAVNRVAVALAGAAGATISVEVYQYDEPTQTWTLLGTQPIPAGEEARFDAVNNPSDTSLTFYVRPLVAVIPNGAYTFLLAADTSTTTSDSAGGGGGGATEATLLTRASEATVASIDGKTPALVGGRVPVDGSGVTQPVSAAALPLPAGASTAALQTSGNASLTSIDGKVPALVSGRVPVDGSAVTQPVSAAALPLPAGAATAANQTTANASLSSIDSKTPALVGGRQPVDGSGVTQPVSAAALPLPAGASTSALQTSGNASLSSIDGKLPTLGPKTAAGSVSIARPLSSQTATGAPTPASSGTIKGSAGRLSKVRVCKRAAGTHYFQLHDAVNVAGISSATMRGAGRTLQGNGDEIVIDFSSVPEEYAAGITWAMSNTQDTYTAVATNVIVEAQWE